MWLKLAPKSVYAPLPSFYLLWAGVHSALPAVGYSRCANGAERENGKTKIIVGLIVNNT
jgi:hypothetical protein